MVYDITMDSGTKPRSRPIAVTVASEREPVECAGEFVEKAGGFVLRFCMGNDDFTVEHDKSGTRVSARGVMSYDIVLSDVDTETLLATPYGKMRFAVTTAERKISLTDNGVDIKLVYVMSSQAAGQMERAVELSARFSE